MRHLYLFSLFAVFSFGVYAQDPDLFDQEWHLYEIYDSDFNTTFFVDGYQPYAGNPQIPQITPYVLIESDLSFSGLGICNTFDGTLEKSPTDNYFKTITLNLTANSCGGFQDMDEPYIIGPFGYIVPDPTFFTIINPQIETDSDGVQTLRFDTQPFVTYTYKNVPILDVPNIQEPKISIYPNPSKDVVTIDISSNKGSLQLFSSEGRLVLETSINQPTQAIDISSLSSGLYFFVIISEEKQQTFKVLKE